MGAFNFREAYIILMSSHPSYLEVGEEMTDLPQNRGSNFREANIIFMSSHPSYLKFSEEILDFPQNGGIKF